MAYVRDHPAWPLATFDRYPWRFSEFGHRWREQSKVRVYEDHSTRYQTAAEYTPIWREILSRSHSGESRSVFMATLTG